MSDDAGRAVEGSRFQNSRRVARAALPYFALIDAARARSVINVQMPTLPREPWLG